MSQVQLDLIEMTFIIKIVKLAWIEKTFDNDKRKNKEDKGVEL